MTGSVNQEEEAAVKRVGERRGDLEAKIMAYLVSEDGS
jgi:hypothetical protein